jgi:hypothetical protein
MFHLPRHGCKGTGPAAKALKTPPADLTTYSKRHGGKFSASDVEANHHRPRGGRGSRSREMPIWGPVFSVLAADDMQAKLRMQEPHQLPSIYSGSLASARAAVGFPAAALDFIYL